MTLEDTLYDTAGDDPRLPECKHDGCGERVLATRGRYAGLCLGHKEEEQERQSAKASGAALSPSERDGAEPKQSLALLARGLVKPAERAERAITSSKAAREEVKDAVKALQASIERLRDATAAMLRE